ncbi:TonB-dependent receptor [Bacteroides sp. 519]|nr:TonB-dependent receptor [Bacteroides sp. 519]
MSKRCRMATQNSKLITHYFKRNISVIFLDASLRWSSGSWQVNLHANNLLDKRRYGYTQYSSLQSYTSWIDVRGREFLVEVGYRF